jgi:hypothetical protein
MLLNIKDITVYIISPGTNNYRSKLITVLERVIDEGFKNVTFFKSVSGPNKTASLTNTVLEIFKRELNNDKPFIILEDDCEFFTKYDQIEIPENTDMLYLGVSLWSYPYSTNTLYSMYRPNIVCNSIDTVESYNNILVKIKAMTATHAILYISRDFIRTFIDKMIDISKYLNNVPHDLLFSSLHQSFNVFGLKQPMFYQDALLGGQENVTKLTFNTDCYR